MLNPFHPSFYLYLFLPLTKAHRWEELVSTHHSLPKIISFSVGKNAQDGALAEKCMFVATS